MNSIVLRVIPKKFKRYLRRKASRIFGCSLREVSDEDIERGLLILLFEVVGLFTISCFAYFSIKGLPFDTRCIYIITGSCILLTLRYMSLL